MASQNTDILLSTQQHHGPGAVLCHIFQLFPVPATGCCCGLESQTDVLGITQERVVTAAVEMAAVVTSPMPGRDN